MKTKTRRTALLLVVALLVMGKFACSRGDRPQTVVLIVIDTLRGDRLGYAGYPLAKTPVLDAFTAGGVMFTQAMTPVPVTLPAVSSLLTGTLPPRHGVRDNGPFRLSDDEVTLSEAFKGAGWRTDAVIASGVLSADRNLTQGFDTYDDEFGGEYPIYNSSLRVFEEELSTTRRRADRVTDLARARIEAAGAAPLFLFVHYFDVHMYYDPPPEFAAMHPGRPYDGEVSFVDKEIGRLLETLESLRPDALVIVTSDHGESQRVDGKLEHGEPQHGFLLYQTTLHIPLAVRGPGIPAGLRRDEPVSLVDLYPTLIESFGLSGAEEPADGRVLHWDRPEALDTVPLYAETFRPLVSYGWSSLRAVRLGRHKLITGPRNELYDLGTDPAESNALDDSTLMGTLETSMAPFIEGDDPEKILASVGGRVDPERQERLASLGYVGGGETGKGAASNRGSPPERPHPLDELPRFQNRQTAKEFTRRAGAAIDRGDLSTARSILDSALVLDDRAAKAYFQRARLNHLDDRVPEALRDLAAARKLDPEFGPAVFTEARWAAAAGDSVRAANLWRDMFEINSDHPEALDFLYKWHLSRGEHAEALPYLRRLVTNNPGITILRLNLGVTASRAGLIAEARRHFERYLEDEPNAPQAAAVREWLNSNSP